MELDRGAQEALCWQQLTFRGLVGRGAGCFIDRIAFCKSLTLPWLPDKSPLLLAKSRLFFLFFEEESPLGCPMLNVRFWMTLLILLRLLRHAVQDVVGALKLRLTKNVAIWLVQVDRHLPTDGSSCS